MDSLKIIVNASVITCDPYNRGGRYDLLIRNDRIVEVTDRPDLLTSLYPTATVVDASNKLVIPGYVNAHFHSESVLLSERTKDLHFSLWNTDPAIQEPIKLLLDPSHLDDVRNVYLMSYFRHLKSGTTCVGEHGLPFTGGGFSQMLQCIERTEVKGAVALQNWDQITKAGALPAGHHRFLVNMGKEDEFTVYSFRNLLRAARELNVPLLAHVAEQRSSTEFIKRTFQKSILDVLQDFGAVRPDTVFVHLNHMSAQEADSLAETGATVVVCAQSAAFKRTGYPLLRHLAQRRVPLAVGTDWGNIDVLEELRFLHQLHLLISGIPPLPPLELIRMATINGARALGLSDETGSIEAGKKADLTFYRLDDLRLPVVPDGANSAKLSALLIDHLTDRDISDVMVNGEFYIAQGKVMTMAEEEILEGFRSTRAKLIGDAERRTSVAPTSDRGEEPLTPPPKILSFTSGKRSTRSQNGGFESGFSVKDEPEMEKNPGKAVPPPLVDTGPRSQRDGSKGAWLTFGDDEDF